MLGQNVSALLVSGLAALVQATTGRWFTPAFIERHPAEVEPVATMFTGTDPEGYAGCAEAIAAMDQRPAVPSITAPTLVIHGTADPLFPLGHGEALAREIPGAELLPLTGVGHQTPPRPWWPTVVAAMFRLGTDGG